MFFLNDFDTWFLKTYKFYLLILKNLFKLEIVYYVY
jgi:hypothetical protein